LLYYYHLNGIKSFYHLPNQQPAVLLKELNCSNFPPNEIFKNMYICIAYITTSNNDYAPPSKKISARCGPDFGVVKSCAVSLQYLFTLLHSR